MSNPLDKMRFAKQLRAPDTEFNERLTKQFEAQADLFTTCQGCKAQLRGTLTEIKAHTCPEIGELVYGKGG